MWVGYLSLSAELSQHHINVYMGLAGMREVSGEKV